MLRPRYTVSLLAIITILVGLYFVLPSSHQLRRQQLLLGTVVEIIVSGPDQALLEDSLSAAFAEIDRIERLMSPHIVSSEVSRLTASIEPVVVSAETAAVIALGLRVAEASDGAFDMTLGRLKKLWDIQSESPRVPTTAEIKTALIGVGSRSLFLDEQTVSKNHPLLAVDLGAIAKGYALDRAANLLRLRGITQASLNAGGDIVLIGGKTPESPWRIGIQDPTATDQTIAVLELRDRAVVTSGDYERFFDLEGVRYHHIFDPATGYPGRRTRSVTVVADSAALADALATAAFILGPESGLALLNRFPEADGLIIDPNGKTHQTPGIAEVLSWH